MCLQFIKMISCFVIFLFTCISVSEEQQLNYFNDRSQFNVEKQKLYTPLQAEPLEYGYGVQNDKLIVKPCTERRLILSDWGYPGYISTYHQTPMDLPKKLVHSPIFLHQLSTELPEPHKHEVSSPHSDVTQHRPTTEVTLGIESKLDSGNEAAQYINDPAPSPPLPYNRPDREKVESSEIKIFRSVFGEAVKNTTRYETSSALSHKKKAEIVRSSHNTVYEDTNDFIHSINPYSRKAAAVDPSDYIHSEHPLLNEAVAFSLNKGTTHDLNDFIHNSPTFLPSDKATDEDPTKSVYDNRRSSNREVAEDPSVFTHSKVSPSNAYDKTNNNENPAPLKLCSKIEELEKDDHKVTCNTRRSMSEGIEMHRDLLTLRTLTSTTETIPEEGRQQETKNLQGFSIKNEVSHKSSYPTRSLPYSPIYDASPETAFDGSVFYPTKGSVITPLVESELATMKSARVCYACSSINDFSCNFPQRGTTVKYCLPGHESCITKTVRGIFSTDADFIVIRDCGNSCELVSTKIHSCSVCIGNLCNNKPVDSGAFSLNAFSTLIVFVVTWGVKLAI